MKHVKIYEEFYSEEEIQGLIDDLSGVGMTNKFKVECNVFVMIPMKDLHPYDWPEWAFRNIETEVSCPNDDKIILEKAFEKVLNGDFVVESNSHLDQMFKDAPELIPVLNKDHMIQLAKKAKAMSQQHERGKLHTLQAKLLIPEIEDLMYERMDKSDQKALRHLDENIGYNVRITDLSSGSFSRRIN